jgi:hypothetical protein
MRVGILESRRTISQGESQLGHLNRFDQRDDLLLNSADTHTRACLLLNYNWEDGWEWSSEDGQQAAASHRQAAGDGVATNGSLSFVRRPTGLRRNHGDNSNIVGRERYAAVLDSERKMPARKKPPPAIMAKNLPQTTTCAIQGCIFGGSPTMQADHKCHNKCGRVFHNLCAQMKDLDKHPLICSWSRYILLQINSVGDTPVVSARQ